MFRLPLRAALLCQKGAKMTTLNEFIGEQLQDPVFKEKYDALEPEFVVMQAMIDARKNRGMTQETKTGKL